MTKTSQPASSPLLQNKTAIVSGVGPGISRSIALAFAREGADVALLARGEDKLKAVAAEVEALGRRAICVPTDVAEPEQCRRAVEATQEAFGRIDILVNNAFLSRPFGQVADADLDVWHRTMEVNFWGNLTMTQAVIPAMRELGEGRVIMINALASRTRNAGFGAYASSKSALLGIARVLAGELGPSGIRVNTVIPGATDTPNTRDHLEQQARERGVDGQVVRDEVAATTALGYITTPDEIAEAVLFFASPMSSGVTGQYLHVSSGAWFE